MSVGFAAADIEDCRRAGHHFSIIGSDKSPMKRSIVCDTCTARQRDHKTVMVAFGVEQGSFGVWRRTNRDRQENAE